MIICLGVSLTLFAFSYRRIKKANDLQKPGDHTNVSMGIGSGSENREGGVEVVTIVEVVEVMEVVVLVVVVECY